MAIVIPFAAIIITPNFKNVFEYHKPDEIIRSKYMVFAIHDSLGEFSSGEKLDYDLSDSLICIEVKKCINFYNCVFAEYKKFSKCR